MRRFTLRLVLSSLLVSCGPNLAALAPSAKAGVTRPPLDVPARDEERIVAAPPASTPPTWSALYDRYFATKTDGGCGRSRACHAAEMVDAPSAYSWLKRRGYIEGSQSAIASTTNSCLCWFGGNMPPGGRPNPEAARSLRAWVAAGAPND